MKTDYEKNKSQQYRYSVKTPRDTIQVINIYSGSKTASQIIHEAAVKKILFDETDKQ